MAPLRGSCIVVCGHLCLDIIPGFLADTAKDWSRPGRLSFVDAPVLSTGGAVSNVGISLDRLGLPVRLIAKLGNDPLAHLDTREAGRTAGGQGTGGDLRGRGGDLVHRCAQSARR